MTDVLISGASIAGPALAYWLAERGFTPVLVERAPTPRPGGQAIDVRGVALEVIRRMGLFESVDAARTRMTGMSALDATGKELWRSTEMTMSAGRFDAGDIEILRDDLSALLMGLIDKRVETIWGDSIVALDQAETDVTVRFESAGTRRFDLVIGADGVFSNVRRLAFGPHEDFVKSLQACIAIFTAENFLKLDNWQVMFGSEPAGGVIYPARDNSEMRVFLGCEAPPDVRKIDVAAQKAWVAEHFADFGWEMPRLLDAMRAAKIFYFGEIAQVLMPSWSRGRIALVGDAGYCPSPLSGQGTSLALVGAYVLAKELAARGVDHGEAFARTEARMRSFVEVNQAIANRDPGTPVPQDVIDHAKNAISLD